MSDILIYLPLKEYLAQWFIHEMGGSTVQFPKRSAESDIIEFFLIPTPEGVVPSTSEPGTVAICLPFYKYKDPRTYNYLPPKAQKALARCIETRFKIQLWQDLHTLHNQACPITDIIYAWMEMHGIELSVKNWETIRQMYFRKRKTYLKKLKKKNTDIVEEN